MKRFAFTFFVIIIAGCGGTQDAATERGSGYAYREGYPEMRITAVGFFTETDAPAIQIVADIVEGSLIYKSADGISVATATLTIQVLKLNQKERVGFASLQIPISIEGRSDNLIRSSDLHTIVQNVEVTPGDFEVILSITDNASNQQTSRKATTSIPEKSDTLIGLTSVRMYGVESDIREEVVSITTHDVQNRYAGLVFENQFLVPESMDSVAVTIKLSQYESDIEHARQMAGLPINPGSIQYKGINYAGGKTLRTDIAYVRGSSRPTQVRHIMPMPGSGNYRLEFSITQPDGRVETRAREFGVKSPWYPNVRTIREMAEPLIYLTSQKEYARMMAIGDPDSLKKEVDRFWLTNIKNRSRAAQVIQLYYSRVEEANKQFSNFKEGWKTDMGMVFILFGPPWYVENSVEGSIWYYSYNRNDLRYVFRFYRPRVSDVFYPYQHYILVRERYYHSVEYEMVENWKSGHVLLDR